MKLIEYFIYGFVTTVLALFLFGLFGHILDESPNWARGRIGVAIAILTVSAIIGGVLYLVGF